MKNILFILAILSFGGCNSEQMKGDAVDIQRDIASPLLTKYIIGKPNMAYFDAEKVVALRWGINLKQVFAGSKSRMEIEKESLKVKTSNLEADRFYDKKFGKDWKIKFKQEVEKEKN